MAMSDSVRTGTAESGPGTVLLSLLRGLSREGAERSFKMSAGSLLGDRYLIGVHKSDITPRRLFDTCAHIGMPAAFMAAMEREAPAANAFHFGYEGRGARGLYKVYLEFATRLRSAPPGPVLLHLAYKWECGERAGPAVGAIARYVCHPALDRQEILDRMQALHAANGGQHALAAASEIVDLAARRSAEPLMFLEVREDGNPRASYDVNLHDAQIRTGEIAPLLARLGTRYGIPDSELGAVLERSREARLGHVSGGISREGAEFLTVYHVADGL